MTNNVMLLQVLLSNAKFESTTRGGATEIVKLLCSETLSDRITYVAEPTSSITSPINKYTAYREEYNEETIEYGSQTEVATVKDYGDKFTVIYPSGSYVDVNIINK